MRKPILSPAVAALLASAGERATAPTTISDSGRD